MPEITVCKKTGAVLYTHTPEEKRILNMEKEIQELKKALQAALNQSGPKKN